MGRNYLGRLSESDPLHGYLQHDIQPQISGNCGKSTYRVYRLAVLSDAQTPYARPELNAVGLSGCFDPILVSGDFGYRKPDRRLFRAALDAMGMEASEVLFVGNDMYRDVHGAQKVGMKAIFFKSNQGAQEKAGVSPDYTIYRFPELLNAIRFFEEQ